MYTHSCGLSKLNLLKVNMNVIFLECPNLNCYGSILQVCPPGLHISLGLFLKHFISMERRCHELDVKIAEQLSHGATIPEVNLQGLACLIQHQSLHRQLTEAESEEKDLLEQLSCFITLYPDESQPVKMLQEAAAEKEKEKKQLVTILLSTIRKPPTYYAYHDIILPTMHFLLFFYRKKKSKSYQKSLKAVDPLLHH